MGDRLPVPHPRRTAKGCAAVTNEQFAVLLHHFKRRLQIAYGDAEEAFIHRGITEEDCDDLLLWLTMLIADVDIDIEMLGGGIG